MVLLTFALLGVAFALIYKFYQNTFTYWERRGVLSERPLPLVGNMKGIGTKYHFRDINKRIYDQFKGKAPFVGIYMFIKRVAFITDLDLVKQVLIKDFKIFHDRGLFNNVRDEPLSGHLFLLEGDEWRSMRQKLTPVFSSGKMKLMFGTIQEVANRLTSTMNKAIDPATSEGGDVEIKELCARFTTDVIGTCAFGLECNSLSNPNAEFRNQVKMFFKKPRHSQLVTAFIQTNPKWSKKLRLKVIPDEVTSFFMNAIRDTVDYRVKNGIKRNDFLDQLIELRAENQEAARQGKGIDLSKGLTLEQMAAQSFVFFVAGFETSSSTMAFCLYELALQPDIQDRLREEIETVLKDAPNGEVNYDAITQMTYLDYVLSETLRKHSIVPHLMREANEDYRVPNTTQIIEKGTSILIPVHNIHHDPEIYPDPQRFDPLRFEPEAVKARHPYSYLPFGDGPRNCIGDRFGKMQSKVGLISLLRHFKFSTSKRTEIPLILDPKNLTMATKNGIYLKVERI